MPSKDRHINFQLMRDRILATQGKQYWRSLEELADTDEFREFVLREYPHQADEWNNAVERRTFLKIMGASLAFAGLSACTYQPPEKIVPYVKQPEEIVPGKALFFATAFSLGGVATGLLAKSNEGRPTKIEGNPDHPASLGATDLFSQASILTLYDPDRAQTLTYREEIRPWTAFLAEIRNALNTEQSRQGASLRFLTETVNSPTLANQLREVIRQYPAAKWHQYEPAARDNVFEGARLAFGQPVNTIYNFANAERILSVDSDFLSCGPANLRYAREFAAKRRVTNERREMNRLYAIETTPTTTGASADHRLPVRPSEIEAFARAIAAGVGASMGAGAPIATAHADWINALTSDLQEFRGRSLVIVGDEQSPVIHALGHAMNAALNNVGNTVVYTDPIETQPVNHHQQLRELVNDINAGQVETLIVLGGNPVYNAPADLNFVEAFNKVKLRVHLSLYKDETSELSHWNIPATHFLETWSDARAFDGTASIVQPLIMPLYNGKSAHELLAVFTNQSDRAPLDIVRDFWMANSSSGGQVTGNALATATSNTAATTTTQNGAAVNAVTPTTTAPAPAATPSAAFEQAWRKWVHDGVIPNTALAAKTFSVRADWDNQTAANQATVANQQSNSTVEIVFRTDPTIYDGRFANNGWLQELPKPLTKLTWDNVALVSPRTAKQFGLTTDIGTHGGNAFADTINLEYEGRSLSKAAPIWIMPGQPDGVITLHLGYGRKRAGHIGTGAGFNAYEIRTSDAPWSAAGVKLTKTGARYELAATQLHFNMENRDIVRKDSLVDYLNQQDHGEQAERDAGHTDEGSKEESMYPPFDYKNQGNGYAWGMAIDISSCVGCSSCVVACQSENNIPIVGKEQVMRGREMQWLRVDSYFGGADESNPEGPYFMPVPCMHCENAPCEPVCPVHATVHSAEGTNDMVYNRCVGTRYCSNNCPYKVRRFNFLLYQDFETPTYKLMRNPEVTVRSRGVMEKCTYCIQRIQLAKIEAENEGRPVRDGEIVTACQAACPTEAIVFGDVNDPNSRVSQLKRDARNYSLLEDLNTRPRTTYLSALRNPNPAITDKA